MRILVLNSKGLNLWNDYKMELFINSCKKKQIDAMLLSETQTKWTPHNIDRMQQRIHSISRNAVVIGADSKQWDVTPRLFLPGRILSIITQKGRSLINEKEIHKGELGNWMAIKMKHNSKMVVMINLYRIPSTSSNSPTFSLTQYNLLEGQTRSTGYYRNGIFKQIKTYIKKN